MSTISVSNITTANGATPLTLATGNTNAGDIIIPPTGGVVIGSNSTINAVTIATGSTANTLVTNATGLHVSTTSNFTGNVNIDSGVLFVDSVNNRVGVSNTTPDTNLTVTGSANVSANVIVGDTVTANVFVGAAPNPFSPTVTVGVVAGTEAIAPAFTTAAAGTLALTANRQYFIPIFVPFVITTATLACEVTTLGTSSSIRMNIYAASATGAPTGSPLAADVLVSSASTGVKTGAYVVTLKPGLYWASMVCNATAPTIRTLQAPGIIGVSTLGATPMYSYVYGSFTFAAMSTVPATLTGVAPATQTPLIAIY